MKYPGRHRNHEIEELSERFFKKHIPASWVVNQFKIDYGTDYNCEITTDEGVTGINFTIQLKGKETDPGETHVLLRNIKRSTINRWLNRLEPTMIIVYVIEDDEAYWTWFKDNTVDLTKLTKTAHIKVSKNNKLTLIEWRHIIDYLKLIFSRKHLLYDLPKSTKEVAWTLFFNDEFEKALPGFREMVLAKNDPIIWNAIAVCNYRMFHYQDALIAINKAIELSENKSLLQNKASFLTEYGIAVKDKRMLTKAAIIFQKLIDLNFQSIHLNYNYANALSALKEYSKAIEQYNEALKINPNYAEAWKNLGSIYFYMGLHDIELDCYENALALEPNLPEALFSKGLTLYSKLNKTEDGLKLMIKSVNLTKRFEFDFPSAFFWIADALISQKKFDLALKWNTKGLLNYPTEPSLLRQKTEIEKNKNAC